MLKKNFLLILVSAISMGIAVPAFAEDAAPVYDADNYPPSFDEQQPADSNNSNASAPAAMQQSHYSVPQPLTLDQRISRMEQQINNMQSKDLSSKLNTLQTDLQDLRGQVEQLSHQLQQQKHADKSDSSNDIQALHTQMDHLSDQLQQVQQQIASDTKSNDKSDVKSDAKPKLVEAPAVSKSSKSKLAAASNTVSSKKKNDTVATASTKNTSQPNVEEEQQIYQTAYDLIKAKKYNEAIAALQKMLQKYPSGQFAANAHYWLGELYGLLNNNDQSALEFGTVVKDYPDSPKVADAQLKLGIIYAAQFKWPDAKFALKQVINHYPGTASARLASEQLKQIKQAGH